MGNTSPKGAKIRSLAGEKVLAITMVCGLLKGESALTALQSICGMKMSWGEDNYGKKCLTSP